MKGIKQAPAYTFIKAVPFAGSLWFQSDPLFSRGMDGNILKIK